MSSSEEHSSFTLAAAASSVPAAIAFASAMTFVLSFTYQWAFFKARGSALAMDNVALGDLVDHAGVASVASIVQLVLIFVFVRFHQHNRRTKVAHKEEPNWVSPAVIGMVLLFQVVAGLLHGWTRMITVGTVFFGIAFVTTTLVNYGFLHMLGDLKVRLIIFISFATLLSPALLGAVAGASEYMCPRPVSLRLTGGVVVAGDLIANLNRAVILSESRSKRTMVVPWPQIFLFSEGRCEIVDGKIHQNF